MLSSHVILDRLRGLFAVGFTIKIMYVLHISPFDVWSRNNSVL